MVNSTAENVVTYDADFIAKRYDFLKLIPTKLLTYNLRLLLF